MIERDARDQGARFLLLGASFVVIVAGLRAATDLLVPLMIALFLAMITLPLLNWLQRKRIPTGLAVPITVLAALLALAAVGAIVGGSIKDFTDQAPKYKERLDLMSDSALAWFEARGIRLSDEFTSDLINPAGALDLVTGTLRRGAAVLSNSLLVLLTVVFILSEAAGFPAKFQAAFGDRDSSQRFVNIRAEVQRYLGIKTLVSLATGGIVAAAMAIIGVDFPLLWGMVAFLLNYIPALGSIIAAIPPMLLALVQLGPGHALAVAIVFGSINIGLGNFLEPHLMGRRLGLSTLVVFLSLVFWGWVWGPVGMLLSVPLTMIVKIMMENTPDLRWAAVLLDAGRRTAGGDKRGAQS